MASGIADYSFDLLPMIAERADVEVVCPRPKHLRRLRRPPGIPVVTPGAFAKRGDGSEPGAAIYHLGNNPFHEFVYDAAVARPGIAVFHDLVLHHLLAAVTVERRGDATRYRALLEEEYGPTGARLARLRVRGVATEFEKFLFPMAGHLARRSKAVIVHSRDARDRMWAVAPGVPVVIIPHHAGSPPPQVAGTTRSSARRELGLDGDDFVVGHFGFITKPKQPAAVVGGFARLAAGHPNARLVMVGADHTGGGLDRLIARHRLQDRVRAAGFVDLPRFYTYLRAVDAIVNLRYPSAGESSGTVARALAEGRATIVNDLEAFAEIPDAAALKVEIDADQADAVGAHLIRLAEDPGFRSRLEASAQAYAAAALDPGRCADRYVQVAQAVAVGSSLDEGDRGFAITSA
jgi:glycosyltransferase involved in cell wall biosynthesis